MTPTQVFIVASTLVSRAGLRSMLATVDRSDVEVVGESAAPADPDRSLAEADVVLVAEEELLEETALADDGTRALLVLSEDEGSVARLRALPLRGWGVVPPDAPPEELEAAISAVARGLIVLPRPLTERLLL